jgi:hypothetical protein
VTTSQKQSTPGRFATITALAVSTITSVALGPAAPAHAAGTFLALAYQPSYEVDAKVIYGQTHGIGQSPDFDTARVNALNDCQHNGGLTGGGQCEVRVVADNECAAVAAFRGTKIGDSGLQWYIATATSYNQQLAEQIAIANNGGGIAVVSACPTY